MKLGIGRRDLGRDPGQDHHEEQELQAAHRHAQEHMAACRQHDRGAEHEIRVRRCGGGGASRSCSLPFAPVDGVAKRRCRPQQSLDQRRIKPGVAEFGLPEHAIARAIGFRQQPDDAHAVRRDQQFLGAPLGKDVEVAGDDLAAGSARLCGPSAPPPRPGTPRTSAAYGRDDRNWRMSSASPAASSCRRCPAPRPFR